MSHMVKLSFEGQITPQGFGQFYKPAEERLNQLLAHLPKLEANFARLKNNQVSTEDILQDAKQIYQEWPNMTADRKRARVESIFEKIEVCEVNGTGKIRVTFSGSPSSEELCKNLQQMAPATG